MAVLLLAKIHCANTYPYVPKISAKSCSLPGKYFRLETRPADLSFEFGHYRIRLILFGRTVLVFRDLELVAITGPNNQKWNSLNGKKIIDII